MIRGVTPLQRGPLAILVLVLSVVGGACSAPGSAKGTTDATSNPDPMTHGGVMLAELAPDPREPALAQQTAYILTEEHLRRRPIDDEVSKKAFAAYLERLDGGKLFLLKSHVQALEASADKMDDQLHAGNLRLARQGAALFAERRIIVAKVVADLLAQPFDFEADDEIETDPDKLAFCETEEELKSRWEKVLKLQILERIAQMEDTAEAREKKKNEPKNGSGAAEEEKPDPTTLEEIPPTLEGKEKKAREKVTQSYAARFTRLESADPLEPAESFLNAVASVYDPHTLYLAPSEKEDFDIEMSGSLEGIGAALAEEGHYIVVREIIPGGASWRQGKLEPADLILAVAQQGQKPQDVTDMPIDKVVRLIRGPKGSVVTLTVKKPDERIEVISITRDVIEIEAAYARGATLSLGAGHEPVGYVYLPSFYGNTRRQPGATGERNAADDMRALLAQFDKRGTKGVIIDLRGNGGGLLDHARDMTGALIDKGPVVSTRYANGKTEVLTDDDAGVTYRGEVIVLVDRFSASASEILAGALQDYGRALVVGTGPTHGKGTVQVLVDLDRLTQAPMKLPLGVFKLTIQQFFRVNGASTQWRGVVPDVVLPDPASFVESGERFLDHSIPWSQVEPLPFRSWNGTKWDAAALDASSKARRASNPVFKKVEARSALLKTRQDQTKLPLMRKKWLAKREADKKSLEAVDPKLEDGEDRFEVTVLELAAPKEGGTEKDQKAQKKRIDDWRKSLSHDPWLEETLHVMSDVMSDLKSSAN